MLKLIPYTKQLISIGNQHHYDGQLVWSDGRVAYGWDYAPQRQQSPIAPKPAGFWVNEQDTTYYRLCNERLGTTGRITADSVGSAFAYPYYAVETHIQYSAGYGYVANSDKYYRYRGALIYLDKNGRSIVYDSSKIYFYSFSNSVVTDSHGYAVERAYAVFYDDDGNQQFVLNGLVAVNNDWTHYYFWDDDLTSVEAEYNNGYITSTYYTGPGTVELSKEMWLYDADTNVVDISMLESGNLLNPAYILAYDGILSSNTNGISIDAHMTWQSIMTAFQVTKYNEMYAEIASKTYDANHLLMMYGNRIEIRDMHSTVLWQGAGILTEDTQNSKKYAYTVSGTGVVTEIARYEGQTVYYNGNTYQNGDIVMAGVSYPYLTRKQYKIFIPGAGTPTSYVQNDSDNPAYPLGLKEDNYPNSVVIDGVVTVSLSTFTAAATIDGSQVTLTGDAFELSQVGSGQLCFPSGLHAVIHKKNLFVINQTTKKIYRVSKTGTVQSASFNGISDCYNLAYLKKRWNRI